MAFRLSPPDLYPIADRCQPDVMRALGLAIIFLTTGFDPVAGILAGLNTWHDLAVYDRCLGDAGPQSEWQCE